MTDDEKRPPLVLLHGLTFAWARRLRSRWQGRKCPLIAPHPFTGDQEVCITTRQVG
ncbi:hypothetical protein JOD64_000399 [Micromonospora luteifusca]|uniref:Alpha/beta hydrolase n=1 Tax=Micromonospora luteifusca TaxID=709860 RepID=A0ABS2LM32_9ACTN|nr:hypothetical protein [Micromonospora luteifusca]